MGNPILEVENLVKSYGDVQAVRGVSFTVEEGEVFGLLGPNGAGKTSTVEILEGLRDLDGGRVSVCGLDPQRDSQALKHEIGAALQSTSLPDKLRVMEALRLFSSFYKRRRNPEELLKRFGLAEKRNAFYGQLSGGQKARVGIARAIALNPDLVILDEPTAALDVSVQAVVLNLLQDLKDSLGMSYLFVSHDLNVVRLLCDRVIVMQAGRIVEQGPTEEVLFAPQAQYTRDLLAAIPNPSFEQRM